MMKRQTPSRELLKEVTMVRLFFILSGIAFLVAGPFSYKPTQINFDRTMNERAIPVTAPVGSAHTGAMLQH